MSDRNSSARMVSVILTTRNRPILVRRAIEHVLSQEGVDIELIVVVDGCEEGSFAELIETYAHRATVINLEQNQGVAAATNVGFSKSTGDYIALLGDDDYWFDSLKLAKQVDLLTEAPGFDFAGSWRIIRQPSYDVRDCWFPSDQKELVRRALAGGTIGGSTALIKREAWEAVKGMDTRHTRGTDSDLFRRLVIGGYRLGVLQEYTTVSDKSHGLARMTPTDSNKKRIDALMMQLLVLRKHKLLFLQHPSILARRTITIARLFLRLVTPLFRRDLRAL